MTLDLSKMTPEEYAKKKEQSIALFKWKLQNEKIIFFADSLKLPWSDIYIGEDPNPDIEEIKSHPGKWLARNPFHPDIAIPFAHLWQRKLLYPWEYPELFERWKSSNFFIWFAGNRGGKSVAGVSFAAMLSQGIHPLQDLGIKRKPPLHGWVVSPNLPSESDVPRGEDAPILKKFYEWLPDMDTGAPWGIKKFYRKDKIMQVVDRQGNQTVINFKSFDQDIDKLKSDDIDFALLDEDPKSRQKFNEVMMRLIDRNGSLILALTPDYDSVFSYQLRREELNNSQYHIIDGSGAEDNPFLSKEEVKKRLDGLSPEERMMKGKGQHIQFRGRVFKKFDRMKNVGDPFIPSKETTQYVIIDWHPVKPVVITYMSINFKGIWYVFDESAISDHRTEVVAREYFQKITQSTMKLKIKLNIIDPIAKIDQIQEGRAKPRDIVDMFKDFGIFINPDPAGPGMGKDNFAPAHAELERKFEYRELYFSSKCNLHIDQFDTWGAKRYQKGNLEGTIRDQLEGEGNDTCVNLIYAHNSGAKFDSSEFYEMNQDTFEPTRNKILYGKGLSHETYIQRILRKEVEKEGSTIEWR